MCLGFIEKATIGAVTDIVCKNVDRDSRLHTDERRLYWKVGDEMVCHEAVNYSKKECARDDVTTNTIEGVLSVFKRGMCGTYQHGDERHLHRHLAEFDSRYNNRSSLGVGGNTRTVTALKASAASGSPTKALTEGARSHAFGGCSLCSCARSLLLRLRSLVRGRATPSAAFKAASVRFALSFWENQSADCGLDFCIRAQIPVKEDRAKAAGRV
jgi:hypothetical protein